MQQTKQLSGFPAFLRLFVPGLLGILSALPINLGALQAMMQKLPGPSAPPVMALMLVSVVQSAVLLSLMILLGLWANRRLNLKSRLLGQVHHPLSRDLRPALLGALLSLGLVLVVSVALKAGAQPLQQSVDRDLLYTLMGMLYGGITEELLMRFGVMAGLGAVLLWPLKKAEVAIPVAVVISSLIFGALHLPYASTLTDLTPLVVLYVLLGNSVAGLVFGWLYWKHNLETAMLAHMGFHLLLSLLTWSGLLGA